ncbi:MAG: hypothetical protein BRD26_05745 [Bacteroidetes bacterium QH_1_64_81]|nr:MAG: hypothetical protein BRD26_05745 [Bacteroidetes bacterium QH_1_64_81]
MREEPREESACEEPVRLGKGRTKIAKNVHNRKRTPLYSRAIAAVLQLTKQVFEIFGIPPRSKPLCLRSPVDSIVLL